jgi:hypothetical protein
VLTPGIFNSATEQLPQRMGVELVEGATLVDADDCVYMRTIGGPQRADVITAASTTFSSIPRPPPDSCSACPVWWAWRPAMWPSQRWARR